MTPTRMRFTRIAHGHYLFDVQHGPKGRRFLVTGDVCLLQSGMGWMATFHVDASRQDFVGLTREGAVERLLAEGRFTRQDPGPGPKFRA